MTHRNLTAGIITQEAYVYNSWRMHQRWASLLTYQVSLKSVFTFWKTSQRGRHKREKRYTFCDVTPYIPLIINRRFRGTYRIHLEHSLLSASCWFLSWFIFRPWRWRQHVPPNRRLIFNELQDVISQKTELFTSAAVRTSYSTYMAELCSHTGR
jgi:hypothetical protein